MTERDLFRDFPDTPDDKPFVDAEEASNYMRSLLAPFTENSQGEPDKTPSAGPDSELKDL